MIYESVPQKYLEVDDMYKVFIESNILIEFIESFRENLSELLIEEDISDLTALNIGKDINEYTNLIDNLTYICKNFGDKVMIDNNKCDALIERYYNKLLSLDSYNLIYETIIDEYNIHISKMIK